VDSNALIKPTKVPFKPPQAPAQCRLPLIIHPLLEFLRRVRSFTGASVRNWRPSPPAKPPDRRRKAALLPVKRPMARIATATLSFTKRPAHSNSLLAEIIEANALVEVRAMSVSTARLSISRPIGTFE
jgi:hypothetical protein